MELFANVKKLLIAFGLSEVDQAIGQQLRRILAVLTLSSLFYASGTTLWYFCFVADTLDERTGALTLTDAFMFIAMLFVIFLLHRKTVLRLMQQIQLLAEKRNSPRSQELYRTANERIENATARAIMVFFGIVVPYNMASVTAQSYYAYYVLEHPAQLAFRTTMPVSYPYDWKQPITYMLTILALTIQYYCMLGVYIVFALIFVGICNLFIAFAADMKQCFDSLDGKIQKFIGVLKMKSDCVEIKVAIYEIVQFHADALQLIGQWTAFYKGLLIPYFYCGGLLWCSILHELHTFIENHDNFVLTKAISSMMSLLPFLFIICHLGETVTITFIDLGYAAYDIPWFLCPVHIQKYIAPIVRTTKKPVYFKSIAGLDCSNDTFKRIMNAGYTFFMALRRFS